jgi:glycosyltransferase involved in cell wall biosynthesis
LNIFFVNSTRRFGGVKAWTLNMGAALKKLGHRVDVFCRKGPFADMADEAGLNTRAVRSFGWDYNPRSIMGFRKIFMEQDADVVICNVGKDLRTAGIGARMAQIPVVLRVGLPGDMKDGLKVRMTHRYISPHVLAPCAFVARGLARELSFMREEDVKVILTGKEPSPAPPEKVNEPRRIITASQLNPDKGHTELLDALADLRSRGLGFTCEILGTGSVEDELKAKTSNLGLEDAVTFAGFSSDVRSRMRTADIFVLPSKSEGLPNALLEALAEGLAPVAGDVGGVGEAWPPAAQGLLFDRSRGARGMAGALESLITMDDDDFLALRKDVWKWFGRELSLAVQAEKLSSWLLEIAGWNSAPRHTA